MNRILVALFALVLGASLIAPARADDLKVRVRGTISAVDHDTISLATASGPTTVLLAPTTRVAYVVKTDLSAIKPGVAVGLVAVPGPNGMLRARAVNVFVPGATPAMGVFAWDTEPGATMNNATVTTIADAKVSAKSAAGGAHVLTLALPSGDTPVEVPAGVPIVTGAPADHSALTVGAHVTILAVKHDDGSLTITVVQVGQNGLVPPM